MNKRNKIIIAAASGCFVLAAAYTGAAQKYTTVFFPNTSVNHIAAHGLSPADVRSLLDEPIASYQLQLDTRTGQETLSSASMDLHLEHDQTLDQLIAAQNPYLWGFHLFQNTEYSYHPVLSYDSGLLKQAVKQLACMNPEQMIAPVDAHISDYDRESGYTIIPEENGTTLDFEPFLQEVEQKILALQPEFSPDDANLYHKPQILSDDQTLLSQAEKMNQYKDLTVIYHFGDMQEMLPGYVAAGWISAAEDGTPMIQEEAVAGFLTDLADRYDTAFHPKELKTTYGPTVTIEKGNYGWRIDQKKEAAALKLILLSGHGEDREPIYLTQGATREGNDYGNTYVEINLTAQHLYYYVNGELIIDTDFVSGNQARRWSTPAGAYAVTYKQKNAVLRGANYATPVTYWMPFNRNIGMHDASWRGKFGGTIYQRDGSHGCINLPKAAAKVIFENIQAGIPVLCYHLEGTSGPAPVPETTAELSDTPSDTSEAASDIPANQ